MPDIISLLQDPIVAFVIIVIIIYILFLRKKH